MSNLLFNTQFPKCLHTWKRITYLPSKAVLDRIITVITSEI